MYIIYSQSQLRKSSVQGSLWKRVCAVVDGCIADIEILAATLMFNGSIFETDQGILNLSDVFFFFLKKKRLPWFCCSFLALATIHDAIKIRWHLYNGQAFVCVHIVMEDCAEQQTTTVRSSICNPAPTCQNAETWLPSCWNDRSELKSGQMTKTKATLNCCHVLIKTEEPDDIWFDMEQVMWSTISVHGSDTRWKRSLSMSIFICR